ncbi:Uncharacterised protein [Mycobacteroides abscessus subsp. abscessus]|nr:Uncharacterised protein [Mycobacteroides abscessus subsp. abscessus]
MNRHASSRELGTSNASTSNEVNSSPLLTGATVLPGTETGIVGSAISRRLLPSSSVSPRLIR